ncbi:hypothetical protein FGIG_01421 [Fasciola gigantica]|uniref:Transmembrane protein 231 n=1 Tax=Fasciola gigantica TaxID=46835 RepID=A0A504Z0F2_FASGI|nr:hypothetical protein FGIG_01421 [Fasciola gigantica]
MAHYSYEFYIEEYTYPETPDVDFAEDWLLLIQTEQENVYSSAKPWKIAEVGYISPSISYKKKERALHLHIEVPKQPIGEIQSIMLMIAFNVELRRYTQIKAHLPTMITLTAPVQSGEIELIGEFTVKQTDTLPTSGQYEMIKKNYETLKMRSPKTLLEYFSTSAGPVYGNMDTKLVQWKSPNPPDCIFAVNATINYASSRLSVRPGFWFTLKFAWVQYLSIALIFIYSAEKLREFVYSHQLVSTRVSSTLNKVYKNEL